MRALDAQALNDIARGGAVLGTGGGGDPYLGTLAALEALREFGSPRLIGVDELDDDDLVVCCVMAGAPMPMLEKLSSGPELIRSFDALRRVLDRPIAALMPIESGGMNGILSFSLAARARLPVVDADGMGRAFPEMDLTTFTLHGIGATPAAMADEHGNTVVVDTVDSRWTERLLRQVVMQFGAVAPLSGWPVTAAQIRAAGVLGVVSLSERIGRALRLAAERKDDPIATLLDVTGGYELHRGKIVDVTRRNEGGWTRGEAIVEAFDGGPPARVTVSFQNENLVVRRADGTMLATVPDLITLIDSDTGHAITTDRLRYGYRVVVLGIPCDAQWRTPAGIELAGPRRFGYEVDYVPVEGLVAGSAS